MKNKELDFYPLSNQPYFDNDKYWVCPLNFLEENTNGLPKEIYIHDVTLRDGEQTPGVVYRKDERILIAEALNDLGVARIEIGMPVISEELRDSIKELVKRDFKSEIVAFARANPDDVKYTIECGVKAIVIEHTVNPYLCKYAYNLDEKELLDRVASNIKMAKDAGLHVTFMGWDFFRTPLEFSKKVYQVAVDNGADALTLVDTFAVATPMAVNYAFKKFSEWFKGINLEFHVHNDFGLANGAAIAAVQGGASGIHTAMNALGERTGNLATEEVVSAFEILMGIKTGVDLTKLQKTSRLISDITNIPLATNKTIFGRDIFGIESGVVSHYSYMMNQQGFNPIAYPYLPEVVGRKKQEYLIGYGSGRLTIKYFLDKHGLKATEEQEEKIMDAIKAQTYITKKLLSEDQFVEMALKVIKG